MDLKDLAVLVTAICGGIATILGGCAVLYAARAKARAEEAVVVAAVADKKATVAVETAGMAKLIAEADRQAAFAAGRRAAVAERNENPHGAADAS